MNKFRLKSDFSPKGDQPQAIEKLYQGLKDGLKNQVLLGVTGSGKTYTIAKVIEKINLPTLVISHNKTLAAQLYQEFRDFFPENAVSYFVSYYDYYQPEAYIPQTDTYIEKETEINEEIDKLRLAATTNILTRPDTLIVASVSCIYNIGSPREYGHFVMELREGVNISRESVFNRLVDLQYERTNFGFSRSTFRVRGEFIDVYPAYEDTAVRFSHDGRTINKIYKIDPISGKTIEELKYYLVYPAKHYMTDSKKYPAVFKQIRYDLDNQTAFFKKNNKLVESQRLNQRVTYDLEMIQNLGYVNGIENYSRYFDGRNPGDPPFSLLDYFREPYKNNWLLIIDESHMTLPQIRGMYNGDLSRKKVLIDFGFRLPAALDNRPLNFTEFLRRVPRTIYASATPSAWEIQRSQDEAKAKNYLPHQGIIPQIIRPTGLIDPKIIIRESKGQIEDLIKEITIRINRKERILVLTLTKRTAEDLSEYLKEQGYKVCYLHSEIVTLDRNDILDNLRLGKFDVVVGINLLREGLDLPEVSLVAIMDADKEGFLRSESSLIQTMGRAARHIAGEIIMYADTVTKSMSRAIGEVNRRRKIQLEYNKTHKITPQSINKPIRSRLITRIAGDKDLSIDEKVILNIDNKQLLPIDRKNITKKLTKIMKDAARDLDFELAAKIRDKIKEISS